MRRLREATKSVLARRGYVRPEPPPTADIEPEFWDAYERCKPFTMAGVERCYALWQATQYVADSGIAGDFVECGVWRGGSSMIAALALLSRDDTTRRLHLFDTFEGMPPPSDRDVSAFGEVAHDTWVANQRGDRNDWCYADERDVRRNMDATGYPSERVMLVAGRVEETIPASAPKTISVLRLDTDWYQSTRHELEHLYPLVVDAGVLMIDDYGHWKGSREAADEYFASRPRPLLNRVDYSARIAVKR